MKQPSDPPVPVLVGHNEGIVTLTLNRPDRLNALNLPLSGALLSALEDAARRADVRAVVLTGAGRAFCAGGDLEMLREGMESGDASRLENLLLTGKKIILAIADLNKPILAAVNGAAFGAGFNLALACGMCIASDGATFAQSFINVGLFPDFGGTYLLPMLIGPARAAELFYTGATITAADAVRMGLVSRTVPHDFLLEETMAIARRIAMAPQLVVQGIREVLFSDHHVELERALDLEIRHQLACFRSDECREGITAFIEKRPPKFRRF